MNGILLIDKEKNWTSNDVVVYLKKSLSVRKIGHLGTLDPIATGVLPITIGKATRLFDLFLTKFKTYIAEFEFGYSTDSLDSTGEITNTNSQIPDISEIISVLPLFQGEIQQIPPQFSAKKVAGKRAYEYARSGEVVELKPKNVVINNLEIISFENKILKLKIECSSGTYVRALGRDIASKLNTTCTMISLVRTKVGNFDLENCKNVKDINKQNIEDLMVSCEEALNNYDKLTFNDQKTKKLCNGCPVDAENINDGYYRAYNDKQFVGVIKVQKNTAKMYLTFI